MKEDFVFLSRNLAQYPLVCMGGTPPTERRIWTIRKGSEAPTAAPCITALHFFYLAIWMQQCKFNSGNVLEYRSQSTLLAATGMPRTGFYRTSLRKALQLWGAVQGHFPRWTEPDREGNPVSQPFDFPNIVASQAINPDGSVHIELDDSWLRSNDPDDAEWGGWCFPADVNHLRTLIRAPRAMNLYLRLIGWQGRFTWIAVRDVADQMGLPSDMPLFRCREVIKRAIMQINRLENPRFGCVFGKGEKILFTCLKQ